MKPPFLAASYSINVFIRCVGGTSQTYVLACVTCLQGKDAEDVVALSQSVHRDC